MSDKPISQTTALQKAACQSVGTKQCAAICLSHSCLIPLGECPSAHEVWKAGAIRRERVRRPNGPLEQWTPSVLGNLEWSETYR